MSPRTEPGDTVRLRGTDILGTVATVRTIAPSGHVAAQVYWAIAVVWDYRKDKAPTWHAYASTELISKS